LSTQDSGNVDPECDAIKLFILTEAQTNQTMVVYDSERSLRERTSTSIRDAALRQGASGKASVPTPTPSPAPASTRAVNGILTRSNPNIRIFDVESWICQTVRHH